MEFLGGTSGRLLRHGCRLAALGWLAAAGWAAVPAATEYQLKAVFLFNFAQFVGWPPEAHAAPDSPIVLGVLGRDPFGPLLEETVRGERIGGRELVVRRFVGPDLDGPCHILFISESESGRLERVLDGLANRPILTVGDGAGFATRGVMIRFLNERNRIRLRINLAAARAAQLEISSKLLRPAEIVGGEGR